MKIYEVYIDSLFLMNFVMNLYLYLLTAKTLRRTATRLRVLTVSLLQSLLFCILLLLPGVPVGIKRFVGPVLVSLGATAIVFQCKKPCELFRCMGYQLVYAFALGGSMKFLFSTFPALEKWRESLWYILGAGLLGYQVLAWWIGQVKRRRPEPICEVWLCGHGERALVKALIDTGNSLTEPVSGKPVSIVEEEILEKLDGVKLPEKYKLIPYHSVGKKNGRMEGYEIPGMVVKTPGKELQWQKVIVGVSKEKLSADGKYQMILHPDLSESEN